MTAEEFGPRPYQYIDEAAEKLAELRQAFCEGQDDPGGRSRAINLACLEYMALTWMTADDGSAASPEDRALMVSDFIIRDVFEAVRNAFEQWREGVRYHEGTDTPQ